MFAAISVYAVGLILVSALTLAATVAVPFVSLRRERPRKGLAYSLRLVPLAVVRSDVRERIQLSFDGRPVPSAVLATLRVRNSGNTPILPGDFENPLTLQLSDEVLELRVDGADPAEVAPIASVEADNVVIEPLLLNPGDSFDLAFILDHVSERPTVSARIAGVKRLTEDRPAIRRAGNLYGMPPRVMLAMLAFSVIGYITLGVLALRLDGELRGEHEVVHLESGQTLCVSHIHQTNRGYRLGMTSGKTVITPSIESIIIKPC
jgi:hypothetical protein